MIKKTAFAVLVLLAALLGYATTRPDTFQVQRQTVIQAKPEQVFALIDDLSRWTAWSPWEALDPAMKKTYGGPPAGVGAVQAWEGNRQAGAGRMEITESEAPVRVSIRLDFIKPFEAHNTVDFTLQAQGNDTRVTWAMHGPSPYVSKLMGVFVSMDRMIGGDFERGLANLKALAEKR